MRRRRPAARQVPEPVVRNPRRSGEVPEVSAPPRARSPRKETTIPVIAVYAPRDRVRALVRTAFPRRQARLVVTKTAPEFSAVFHQELIDAAIVDLGTPSEDLWGAVALAREFPSAPFFGVSPLRSADTPVLARAIGLDLAGLIVEGVDDNLLRPMVLHNTFRARLARALHEPPPVLALTTPLQLSTWVCVVAHGGLPVRTDTVARFVGVTREHLSRAFATAKAPNLKRVIDLVRLVAAAELAKNPGYDLRDVAGVLGFASPSHLSSTTQRIVGLRPPSLARLRAVDLIGRFVVGRGRSRAARGS